jgi:hypothetical protein
MEDCRASRRQCRQATQVTTPPHRKLALTRKGGEEGEGRVKGWGASTHEDDVQSTVSSCGSMSLLT